MTAAPERTTLRDALGEAEPIYIAPDDDIAELVISPALAAAQSADVMIGFFSSGSLREISPGLAAYLKNASAPLRLIISPFLSEDDREALANGARSVDDISRDILFGSLPDADTLELHTLRCLSWLTRQGRLQVKIAIMRNALFHSKVWLLSDESDVAALHGSANMTGSALSRNHEQVSLARNWVGEEASRICHRLREEFEELWLGGDVSCRVVDLPHAIERELLETYRSESPPGEEDFRRLWRRSNGLPLQEPAPTYAPPAPRQFHVPQWLNYTSGDYAHQGAAVNAWTEAGWRGILEMCTGSGKTLTAMIGAQKLSELVGPLLIVIAAPYRVLVRQWCEEIRPFGLEPVDLTEAAGPGARDLAIADARRRLRFGISPSEALVVSNDTLCTPEFTALIEKHSGPKLLIADECHNLGAEGFRNSPPEMFTYRLGLSATPVRQYDNDGTDFIFSFFGNPCFSFTLEQAIGKCLTPYDYHVHFVALEDLEMAEWRELSDQIARLAWKIDAGVKDEVLEGLFLKRRRVLETASHKIDLLAELLTEENLRKLRYTLIYATDKDPRQLQAVNALLSSRDLLFHQLTAEETADPKRSALILSRFQSGGLQVLTAKRVLDEGVNVPQIERAYLLASTTVKRQWVQRRGRLLRTCKEIGKTHAVIHDLVALPPQAYSGERLDSEAKKIVRSELDRVWEFARLSRNAARDGGPFEQVERLRLLLN